MDHLKLEPPHDIGFWEYAQHDRTRFGRAVGWLGASVIGGALLGAVVVLAVRFIEAVGRALGWG